MKSVGDDSRDTILDAAERVFATHGFEGASMRLIAREAGVAQALLHYHFKTKDGLYETIFARRSTAINAFREERLAKLFAECATPSLEDIIEVMFVPSPVSIGSTRQGSRFFAPMVSAISIGEDERAKSLMIKHYDPIARKFIAGFRSALPGLSQKDAVWAYLFALGARTQTNMQNGRAVRLGGKSGKIGNDEIRNAYVGFVAAGIRSMIGAKGHGAKGVGTKSVGTKNFGTKPRPARAAAAERAPASRVAKSPVANSRSASPRSGKPRATRPAK